jgi:hypothetical protein
MALQPALNITANHTDIWLDFWNNTFLPALQTEIGGAGSWPSAFTRDGRIVADEDDAGAAQMTGSPSLAIILPDGAQYVVNGVLRTVDGDQTLTVPDSFEGWLVPTATVNETTGVVTWGVAPHEERPALGSGVLGKVTSNVDQVTALDTGEAQSDVILTMPLLLQRLNGGDNSEEASPYWDLLKRSAIDPTTIAQYVQAQIAANLGPGQGATIIPPEVRDEVMVNVLHGAARDQTYHNDAFTQVPPFHAIVVSPGRGEGDWEYSDLTDEELTTMPVDEVNHVFGQVA